MQPKNTNKQNWPPPTPALPMRLQYLMDVNKIDQAGFVAQTGINKSTVSQWMNGHQKIGLKNSRVVAKSFGCDPYWVKDGSGEPFPENDSLSTGAHEALKHKTAPDSGKVTTPIDIPVVGKVPAGIPETNEWEIEYNIQVPGMPKHCYAMKVIGDSMEPRIMEGEHVIFTLDYTLESGNVVIVTDEYGDSMVKRYKVKNGVQHLVSDNSKYPSVKPNGGFHIVGKVINSVLIKRH